jgi:hypothetical protein
MLAGAKKDVAKWEYARVNFSEFGNWSWVESGVYTVAEEIDELCRQLAIEIPQDEPASLFVIFDWAGANGWQLQTMEQRRGYVEGWFKRPR